MNANHHEGGGMQADPPIGLYFSPGACSRVSLIALEEVGVRYTARQVLLAGGDHKTVDFRTLNPKGKIPVLVIGDQVLTENVAILTFLSRRYPRACLLPHADLWEEAEALSLLAWCASGLHPLMTRLRLPRRFCDLPGVAERVQELAREEMTVQLGVAEQRLSQHPWMLGATWSIVDAYLLWVWARCPEAGINAADFPCLCGHEKRSMDRPAVQRAIQREDQIDTASPEAVIG